MDEKIDGLIDYIKKRTEIEGKENFKQYYDMLFGVRLILKGLPEHKSQLQKVEKFSEELSKVI